MNRKGIHGKSGIPARASESRRAGICSGAFGFHERIVDLDVSLREFAARIRLERKLGMPDAITYAAAQTSRVRRWLRPIIIFGPGIGDAHLNLDR